MLLENTFFKTRKKKVTSDTFGDRIYFICFLVTIMQKYCMKKHECNNISFENPFISPSLYLHERTNSEREKESTLINDRKPDTFLLTLQNGDDLMFFNKDQFSRERIVHDVSFRGAENEMNERRKKKKKKETNTHTQSKRKSGKK